MSLTYWLKCIVIALFLGGGGGGGGNLLGPISSIFLSLVLVF